jgi:hypothetical protein
MSTRTADQINFGSGLGFVGFGLAAVAVGFYFPGWPPEFSDGPQEWAAFYRTERVSILVSVVLTTVGLAFLTWFFASLHGVFREAEPGPIRFADVSFGAAIFGIGAIHIAMLCFSVAAFRADKTMPDMIMMMNDMAFLCGVPAAAAGIAFFASTALLIFRTDVLPKAMGWFAAVSAVLQAGPLGGAFTKTGPFNLKDGLLGILFVFLTLGVWTALASILMIRRAGTLETVPR